MRKFNKQHALKQIGLEQERIEHVNLKITESKDFLSLRQLIDIRHKLFENIHRLRKEMKDARVQQSARKARVKRYLSY